MTSVAVYGSLFGFVCLENILSVSPRLSSALLLFCSSGLLDFWTNHNIQDSESGPGGSKKRTFQ
jgi:hypothetical protein